MQYLKSAQIRDLGVEVDLEFKDLTIIIGRNNAGKTRILQMLSQFFSVVNPENDDDCIVTRKPNTGWFKGNYSRLKDKNELTDNNWSRILRFDSAINKSSNKFELLQSPRGRQNQFAMSAKKTANVVDLLHSLDNTIDDAGGATVERKNGNRALTEEGSGIHNAINITERLEQQRPIYLIDEPENSLFPQGKATLLKKICEKIQGNSQVILTTHDPTFINTHLLRRNLGIGLQEKVNIYAFVENAFIKVNLTDPRTAEANALFLTQTTSTRPIQIALEGATDYFVFKILLQKYLEYKQEADFPNIIERVNFFYVGGANWEHLIWYLPSPEYYTVLMILDGEYREKISKFKLPEHVSTIDFTSNEDYKAIRIFSYSTVSKIPYASPSLTVEIPHDQTANNMPVQRTNKTRLYLLKKEKIERYLEKIFDEKITNKPKPTETATKMYNLPTKRIKEISESKDEDLVEIKAILDWIIDVAKKSAE